MSGMQFIGGREMSKNFRATGKNISRHYGSAMRKSVITIVSNTRPLTPVFQGRLRNSIASEVQDRGAVIRGLVGSTMREIYPSAVEHGRKPGKMPPPQALERWVELVLRVPTKDIKGTAYVIARAIGRRGTRPRFMLNRGYRKSLPKIRGYFKQGTNVFVKGLTSRGS